MNSFHIHIKLTVAVGDNSVLNPLFWTEANLERTMLFPFGMASIPQKVSEWPACCSCSVMNNGLAMTAEGLLASSSAAHMDWTPARDMI